MLNTNQGETKMITLTENETKLAKVLIDLTDGTNSAICYAKWLPLKELNMNMKTVKGVFGSLVKKGFLYDSEGDEEGYEVYYWSVNVHTDIYGREINTVDELIKSVSKSQEVK
jgi:hypothetical protein